MLLVELIFPTDSNARAGHLRWRREEALADQRPRGQQIQ
jgi:hypothetical protein